MRGYEINLRNEGRTPGKIKRAWRELPCQRESGWGTKERVRGEYVKRKEVFPWKWRELT